MDYHQNLSGHVMTLANSIIGVSVLAMPYCFKQCGILLSILMLLISSIISRLACHFLMKSAIISRRKTFEFLAFYIFGALGKFAIEVGIIGFLLGTCIAFFVVMGDLGPEIITEISGVITTNTMRTSILMALALFCVLPLGLLRNVDSLNGVSKATIGFYCCLVLKIVLEALPHIFNGDWFEHVVFWRPAGLLQCLPIFSMALFCQTQLFEIYQALPNATLEKMNHLVRIAVNICTCVYIFVGIFGYIAFAHKPFTGNILLSFSPSFITDVLKVGFILSVAFSFPLVIFPCRASLYSLLFKEGYSPHDGMSNYIPEGKFKGLTFIIVFISLVIGIMIPNIELVLGLVGSTIGVMICVLFPVVCFICLYPNNTNERLLAQLMLVIGIIVMVLGTYKNLYTYEMQVVIATTERELLRPKLPVLEKNQQNIVDVDKPITIPKLEETEVKNEKKPDNKVEIKEVRHEPPQPEEPVDLKDKSPEKKPEIKEIPTERTTKLSIEAPSKNITKLMKKLKENDEVDIEAIKKEETELKDQEKEEKHENPNQVLLDTIKKQSEFQEKIVEQQKKLIEVIQKQQEKEDKINKLDEVNKEKLKAVKQIESIALEAIERISKDKITDNTENVIKKDLPSNSSRILDDTPILHKLAANIESRNKSLEKLNQMMPLPISLSKKNMELLNKLTLDTKERVKEVNDKLEENIVNTGKSEEVIAKADKNILKTNEYILKVNGTVQKKLELENKAKDNSVKRDF